MNGHSWHEFLLYKTRFHNLRVFFTLNSYQVKVPELGEQINSSRHIDRDVGAGVDKPTLVDHVEIFYISYMFQVRKWVSIKYVQVRK